jgi:uncharacterized membrane protein YvlD (DUF360 family)
MNDDKTRDIISFSNRTCAGFFALLISMIVYRLLREQFDLSSISILSFWGAYVASIVIFIVAYYFIKTLLDYMEK